jgi:hypothetical protein
MRQPIAPESSSVQRFVNFNHRQEVVGHFTQISLDKITEEHLIENLFIHTLLSYSVLRLYLIPEESR